MTPGPYHIRLKSKAWMDLNKPDPQLIDIFDIASALGKACRFGCRCNRFYSVAEHSVLCHDIAIADGLSEDVQRTVLMHDAHEAYLADLPSPLKQLIGERYQQLTLNFDHAIVKRFDIKDNFRSQKIKEIDFSARMNEKRLLFDDDGVPWAGELDRSHRIFDVKLGYWSPDLASEMFLDRCEQLGLAPKQP